jgi:membrane protein DedA with SNARE-associated domain
MFEALTLYIGQHWFLSTYLSVMVLNESAIITAFSLAAPDDSWRLSGVALASVAGALTNDLVLYALARFGATRFLKNSEGEINPAPLYEKAFLGNPFLALLGIKFLFGVRLVLTVYLVAKKRLPIGKFIAYDLCGIALYVLVIGGVGLLVGRGNAGIQETYIFFIRIAGAVGLLLLITHVIGSYLRKWR